VFPDGSVPYDPQTSVPIAPGTPLFPSQIVESASLLLIFGILSIFFRHRRAEGEVAALYLALYSILRFADEFFRGDTHLPGVMSLGQWISIFTFFAALILFAWVRGNAPRPPAPGAAK
jgi:phosphatidylglycerol:prolipoprotein diacylglycerol transferase